MGYLVKSFLSLMCVLLLSGCEVHPVQLPLAIPTSPMPPEKMVLSSVMFADLQGWNEDNQAEALSAFRQSCKVRRGKNGDDTAVAWAAVCAAAKDVPRGNDAAARQFFESNFTPYAVSNEDERDGLFTGYYEAELEGSMQRGGRYQTPLWQTPHDLVTVELGNFRSELKGQRIVGKVSDGRLVPYDDRRAIAAGALESGNRAEPLLWVADPTDAFFLEIQGSGRVNLPDGSVVRVGYAAQNGHSYVPIGRVLAEQGALARPVTMAAIRQWLQKHSKQAQAMMNNNPSVVFFRVDVPSADDAASTADIQPKGASGARLTPERSLAVDKRFIALGTPVWLRASAVTTSDGRTLQPPLQRLMVAQDTGGAIKGVVRGDVFWGHGKHAEDIAGAMQSKGEYVVLLPRGTVPIAK